MIVGLITLNKASPAGLVRQLFEQIRSLVETGDLAVGTRLPPSRQLATELGVGRNTVISAYEQLVMEGYLQSGGRCGTWVSDASLGFQRGAGLGPPRGNDGNDGQDILVPRLSQEAERLSAIGRRQHPASRTFQPGLPEVRHFPHDLWGRILRRAARQVQSRPDQISYAHYTGLPALQKAILGHVSVSRGVVASPDQIIVLSSAQSALDLVSRLLLNAGDHALHEEPGYAGMLAALNGVGANNHPIDMFDPDAYRKLSGGRAGDVSPRLVYVTPSHQFPTGRVMSLEDRLALMAFAVEEQCFILEDDYDSEFHFSGSPISCLQGLDRSRSVIYMGTFSKSLMPSLHVAYLVVPPKLIEPARRVLRNVGAVPALVVQQALADFISEGHFRAHVREMGKLYEIRRDTLVSQLKAQCGAFLDPAAPEGGIQLSAYLKGDPPDKADVEIAAQLANEGVESSPLSSLYWSGQVAARQGLFLGFAASDPEEIIDGVGRIAKVFAANTT